MPKFTEGFAATIEVPPGARDVLVFDSEVRGFGIRKFAGGAAYYFVKVQLYKDRCRWLASKLGPTPCDPR